MTQFCVEEAVTERARFLEQHRKATEATSSLAGSEPADPMAEARARAQAFARGEVN